MQNGVLRPSVSDYFHEFFSNSVQNNGWPEGWMEWWDAERVARFCKALRPTQGGIWFHIGRGLDGAAFLQNAQEYAASLGAQFDNERVTPSDIPEPGTLRIFTNGYDAETWTALAWLRLRPVKGQMDCYEAPFELPGPISADGYAMTRDGFLFCGSTYEHSFTEFGPTFQASLQLLAKMQVNYAYPMMEAKLLDSWTGVRVSTPDRKPVVGEIPGYPGRWIATGLGSKGLLMSFWLAEMLSEHLLEGIPLHPQFAIERFKKRWSNSA
jgi:glycine/D-amino acid oxidase-like deaminating enzyme